MGAPIGTEPAVGLHGKGAESFHLIDRVMLLLEDRTVESLATLMRATSLATSAGCRQLCRARQAELRAHLGAAADVGLPPQGMSEEGGELPLAVRAGFSLSQPSDQELDACGEGNSGVGIPAVRMAG